MLLEIYIFFQLVLIVIFLIAFFTQQEILWAVSLLLSGVLMFATNTIEVTTYQWNTITSVYDPVTIPHYYPYLIGINMLFFVLSLGLGLFDIFNKYGDLLLKKTGK